MKKHLIRPDRLRQVPTGFSWVDHRLVRQNYLEHCDCVDLALYLFLITVSDAQGLSYYSDQGICRRLRIELDPSVGARGRHVLDVERHAVVEQRARRVAVAGVEVDVLVHLGLAGRVVETAHVVARDRSPGLDQILSQALKGGAA